MHIVLEFSGKGYNSADSVNPLLFETEAEADAYIAENKKADDKESKYWTYYAKTTDNESVSVKYGDDFYNQYDD